MIQRSQGISQEGVDEGPAKTIELEYCDNSSKIYFESFIKNTVIMH